LFKCFSRLVKAERGIDPVSGSGVGVIEADRTQIEQRLNFTRQNYRMMREAVLKILYWRPDNTNDLPLPAAKDRVEAAKSVSCSTWRFSTPRSFNGLVQEAVRGALAKEIHYEPLPGEVGAVIVGAWKRCGLLPTATVEQMVPEK